jgi:ABC-type glutathione transport system ATPase component
MEVIAFIGPPGTGKSDRALVVAYENHASCIIDDGILIYHNRIVAGSSAKKEESRLKAVRRAIFQDPQQILSVQNALKKIHPNRVLILGTSDRMVLKITEALELPAPKRYIHIEEVARPEDIKKANESRMKEGKHVIPVPTMELKPHFQGYLVDPIKSFFHRKKGKMSGKMGMTEKSVVRPVFSYYGKLVFSDKVFSALVHYALIHEKEVIRVEDVSGKKSGTLNNGLILSVGVVLAPGTPDGVKAAVNRIRRLVQDEIEYTTGMSLDTLRISIVTDVSG